MNLNWYVINITSGFEQKIKNTIETSDRIRKVFKKALVPTVKKKRFNKDRLYNYSEKIFPGYVFVCCAEEHKPDILAIVLDIPGILNMSGINGVRRIMSDVEDQDMSHVFRLMEDFKEEKSEHEDLININSKVKITSGPFASFDGIVADIHRAKNKETKLGIDTLLFNQDTSRVVIPISCVELI
jgi:transcriptional antiterminator NusG